MENKTKVVNNNDDIVICEYCGENVFREDIVNTKLGKICKCCEDTMINGYSFYSKHNNEEEQN